MGGERGDVRVDCDWPERVGTCRRKLSLGCVHASACLVTIT
jgi:hypothetical protein